MTGWQADSAIVDVAEGGLQLGVARLIGYFALLDILVFPYFPRLVMPYSLPVVAVALLFGTRFRWDRELALVIVIAMCVFSSAALSLLYRADFALVENMKRAFQLISTFAYFFYFRWLGRRGGLRVTPILIGFLVYFCVWMMLWTTDPQRTADWLAVVYPSGSFMSEEVVLFLRFPYAFSDPNNAAYFFLIAAGFLTTMARRLSALGIAALVVIQIAALVATQSRGAMLAFGLVSAVACWRQRRVVLRHPILVAAVAGVVIIALVLALNWLSAHTGDGTQVGMLLKAVEGRLTGEQGDLQSGRSVRYEWALTHNIPFLIGRGYVIVRDGAPFSPHSDHVRFLLSYGILAWVAVVVLFFRKLWSAYAFALPALVAFSINTLIDEQKMLALYLVALAVWLSTRAQQSDARQVSPPERAQG